MGVCPGFSCPREGESGEAPPVAEEASRFRGGTPVCGRETAGNRKRRDGGAGCIWNRRAGEEDKHGCRPREGCGLHQANV